MCLLFLKFYPKFGKFLLYIVSFYLPLLFFCLYSTMLNPLFFVFIFFLVEYLLLVLFVSIYLYCILFLRKTLNLLIFPAKFFSFIYFSVLNLFFIHNFDPFLLDFLHNFFWKDFNFFTFKYCFFQVKIWFFSCNLWILRTRSYCFEFCMRLFHNLNYIILFSSKLVTLFLSFIECILSFNLTVIWKVVVTKTVFLSHCINYMSYILLFTEWSYCRTRLILVVPS